MLRNFLKYIYNILKKILLFLREVVIFILNLLKKLLFSDKKENDENSSSFKETVKNILIAFVLAVIIRSFFYEPFHIPSGSMKPGLQEGDFIFVSKYTFGYSKYSFPFAFPPFEGRVFFKKPPKRGEVLVFRLPQNTKINYIKRLIGLPGDRVQMKNGFLYVNDVMVTKNYIGTSLEYDGVDSSSTKEYFEELDGVKYVVFDKTPVGDGDNTKVFTVPEKHYFFMGDNRDNSIDSRFTVGFVPEENLIGRANIIFMSSRGSLLKVWDWHKNIRFNRIFKAIK